ncbi:MAG: hypothetical protein O3B95_05100 [Chloroflexi bacterium]|nr:hypothetical protein [Chloroflexota bacterium]
MEGGRGVGGGYGVGGIGNGVEDGVGATENFGCEINAEVMPSGSGIDVGDGCGVRLTEVGVAGTRVAVGTGVAVEVGIGVAVAGGTVGTAVGGTGVPVAVGAAVGSTVGTGVGNTVGVGGTVGGTKVTVGGTAVAVGGALAIVLVAVGPTVTSGSVAGVHEIATEIEIAIPIARNRLEADGILIFTGTVIEVTRKSAPVH